LILFARRLHRCTCSSDCLPGFCVVEEPARGFPRRRSVLDQGERSRFVVATNVLRYPCRHARDARLFPRCALRDPKERGHRSWDVVWRDNATCTGRVAESGDRAVEGWAQAAGFVMTRRDRTRRDRCAVIDDRLCERLHDRLGRSLNEVEGVGKDAMLKLGVIRFAEWTPQRKVAEQPTRRRGALDLATDRSKGNCGETSGFEDVGKHTHGARAEWSNRSQQNNVDAVVSEQRGTGRTGIHADGG
jgi:hypothetical protein